MRSEIAKRILANTKPDSKIFAKKYADIVLRINFLLKKKGFTQKDLAGKMDKKPSEISRWLIGEHNFTIRSIAKLEAELGEDIIYVPKHKTIELEDGVKYDITISVNNRWGKSRSNFNENEFYEIEKYSSK